MTPEEIKQRRQELDMIKVEMEAEFKLKREELKLEYRRIQIRCKHPEAYNYSIMGRETGWRCPDCGENK